MNRRDFLKKTAVVPAVVAVPVLAKVPDRMPVPAAPEVVDAAWDELMADAIWDEADAIPTGFGLASTKTPPGFGNGTIRFPTIIKRTLT